MYVLYFSLGEFSTCFVPYRRFGYDGAGPSHLLRLDDSNIWEIDAGAQVPGTMRMLQEEVENLLGRTAADATPM